MFLPIPLTSLVFIAKLKAQNIDVVFRYTDEGRIYGVTFIDHGTMTVLNGSRLGQGVFGKRHQR